MTEKLPKTKIKESPVGKQVLPCFSVHSTRGALNIGGKMKMQKVAAISMEDAREYLDLPDFVENVWFEECDESTETLIAEWSDGSKMVRRECNQNLDIPCQILIYEDEKKGENIGGDETPQGVGR